MKELKDLARSNNADYVSVSYSIKSGYSLILMKNGQAGIGVADNIDSALAQAKKELAV